MKTQYFRILLLAALVMSRPVFAEEPAPAGDVGPGVLARSEKEDASPKTRQAFNKLRRTSENIYKVTMRSTVAFRLQTALGYLSTIDLPEKALKVFVGDQDLFKVEVYERQVLIKPVTDERDARTNLVIVTASNRLAFDVSVGPPETADFVLDFRLPEDDESFVRNAFDEKVGEKVREFERSYRTKEEILDKKAEELSEEKLKEKVASGVRTMDLKKSEKSGGIQVTLVSLSQVADKAYLRFAVLNDSRTPYKVLKALVGVRSQEKKFLRTKTSGLIELASAAQVPSVIPPNAYEYGVIVFDYRGLGKKEKPVFRLVEDCDTPRDIEIKGFGWLE